MKTGLLVGLGLAAVAVVYLVTRKKTVRQPNYGVGGYGVQTHIPVANTGVALASILGSGLSSWFGGTSSSPAAVPRDRNTPYLGDGQITNPVYPLPTVLPYSYKQQTIDTPVLLGTDALFTPSLDGSGSSGSYADQGTSSDILNNGF